MIFTNCIMSVINQPGVVYVKATTEDAVLLSEMRLEFLEDYWGKQEAKARDHLRMNLIRYYSQTLANETYICYLAYFENNCIGLGGMILREQAGSFKIPNGKVAYLMNMYTQTGFRKRGVATQILALLTKEARAREYEALELHATKDGEPVYQRAGFYLHSEPTYRKLLL